MYYIVKESERASEFLADKKKVKQTWIDDKSLAKEFKFNAEAEFAAGELRRNDVRVVDEEQAACIQDDMEYAGVEANYLGDE